MTNAYDLHDVTLVGPSGTLFESLTMPIPDRAVTVVLGPAGTGKSTLLRALSGEPPGGGWLLRGSIRFFGARMFHDSRLTDVAFAPQATRSAPASATARRWRDAFAQPARVVLLDEPTRGEPEASVAELAAAIRASAATSAVVVVTHDVAFARATADHVRLLCARRLEAGGPAGPFFAAPPTDLARRFVEQGNCWPAFEGQRALPQHFRWVIPSKLAGMARPGLLGSAEEEVASIAAAGIDLLVSLTEEPFPPDLLRPFGITPRHHPIADMGVPAVGTTARLCRDLERTIAQGGRVAVHCHAGLGRTGTILASMLVWLGHEPEAAVAQVRSISKGYLQTQAQLDFVRRFAEVT